MKKQQSKVLKVSMATLALLMGAGYVADSYQVMPAHADTVRQNETTNLINASTTWNYLDNNVDPGTSEDRYAWTKEGYQVDSWKSAAGKFGAKNGALGNLGGGFTPTVLLNQYIEGTFPPCITYDITKAVKSMHGMMVAHAKAVCAYKEKGYKGKIGIIHSLETKYPLNENDPKDVYAAKKEDVLANQFLLDATFLGYYTDETIKIINELVHINNGKFEYDPTDIEIMKKAAKDNDYLGMNHYQSHFIKAYEGENEIHHNGTGEKGTKKFKLKGVGERVFKEGIPTTDWDWLIYPEGMYDMIMRIKNQYPNYKAIYITENGMGYKDHFDNGNIDDSPRIDYIKQHLQWLLKSIEDGANVKGYFVWSLMDVFSWSNGYNKRYGLFYVDYDTQERYPKKSAYWYKKVIETREV